MAPPGVESEFPSLIAHSQGISSGSCGKIMTPSATETTIEKMNGITDNGMSVS